MIVSVRHKFVFVKTRKVAGTSLELALRPFLGPDDIVPPITPRDEICALQQGFPARNWALEPAVEHKYRALVAAERFEEALIYRRGARPVFQSHMTVPAIKRRMREKDLRPDEYFFFTIDRNPYTYMLSSVLYSNRRYNAGGAASPADDDQVSPRIVRRLTNERFLARLNYRMYSSNKGVLLVDRVLRY